MDQQPPRQAGTIDPDLHPQDQFTNAWDTAGAAILHQWTGTSFAMYQKYLSKSKRGRK